MRPKYGTTGNNIIITIILIDYIISNQIRLDQNWNRRNSMDGRNSMGCDQNNEVIIAIYIVVTNNISGLTDFFDS